jgi:glucose/arabinose dehydrogenase
MNHVNRAWKWALIFVLCTSQVACKTFRDQVVEWMTPNYAPALETGPKFEPVFDELDLKRERIDTKLSLIKDGFIQLTGIEFVPNRPELMIVLEKFGRASWTNLQTKESGTWFEREVPVNSEQGLLSLVFDPHFAKNGRFYINESTQREGKDFTRLVRMQVDPGLALEKSKPKMTKTILEVEQPYPNHNAGKASFGSDGYLYLALGDGGWADDPENYGQNKKALLGKILRLDLSNEDDAPYRIPTDNPFVNDNEFAPEIWAWGFRNPWKFSFDPQGRLIVADLGQDRFEEISIIERGDNAGWKVMEASHCFEPRENCDQTGLRQPIYEYGREDGGGIIGGYVATDPDNENLRGLYVFGDFLSGRLWALKLPKPQRPQTKVYALGRWAFLPTSFGKDAQGRLYVGAYTKGTVHRLDAK